MGYEEDYYLWIQNLIKQIQKREFEEMDWDNLMEEMEDMGKSQKRAIESLLLRLTEHILKLKYWEEEKERNSKHWQAEIVNFRALLKKRFKDSPSLKAVLPEMFEEILIDAKNSVSNLFLLPKNIDLTLEEVLDYPLSKG